jgi:hypothetical protein
LLEGQPLRPKPQNPQWHPKEKLAAHEDLSMSQPQPEGLHHPMCQEPCIGKSNINTKIQSHKNQFYQCKI